MGFHVRPMNERLAGLLRIPFNNGAIIVEVNHNSAAEKAGIKVADVIVSVNSIKVNSASDIFDVIRTGDLRSGDKLKLRIYRDGKYRNVTLKLAHSNQG
jgi:S1-C subfamily serine protease